MVGAGSSARPKMLEAAMFVVGMMTADAEDRIVYGKASGALCYDAEGVGRAAQVKIAQLDKGLLLTNKDFFVI